ncbi:hypothetical protein CDD83_5954 [Cordyceps sp. RAO-2017]|nr:hypothetical protein CDD83_5954 [Cordyceps sp. RAO-2017]
MQYYRNILDDVNRKRDAGFNTSITDYWGRMLSYQLVNARDGGPGYTFSSIANDSDFAAARTPLPFLVADARAPGETILMTNATVFDFSPWELGTSDAAVNGYAPLRFVGSRFEGGRLPSSASCVAGFDNAGFVMGTSSSLFNQVVLRLRDGNSRDRPSDVPGFIVDALTSVLQSVGERDDDIADWTPNPFRGWNPDRNPGAGSERLTLVDGGEDNQNIPYHPQLLTERAVDVIFSVDSSADTNYSWPNGSAPMNTYRRSLVRDLAPGSGFPVVPSTDSFLNLGLNTRPAFFGCDAGNRSSDAAAPLVVYLPNYPYLFASNISTFTLSLSNAERDAMVKNGWALATQLNGSRDADWPACVGCAMLARSFDRTRTTPPDKCRQCFDRYCWDGSINQTQPRPYVPRILGTPINVESNGAAHAAIPPPAASAALLATLLALLL